MKLFLVLLGQACVLNAMNYVFEFDYLLSVLLVMVGLSSTIVVSLLRSRDVTANDYKSLIAFVLFSNVMTVIVEYFMLKYDVWAFSKQFSTVTGWMLFGAPVEEFVYWFCCPVIVAGTYLLLVRSALPSVVDPKLILRFVEKLKTLHLGVPEANSKVTYTETDANGQYRRGGKFPVYIYLQILIVTAIVLMLRYFRGSWKAVAYTTVLFLCVAFPHEYYSVGHGFWVYNVNHELGWFFMRVPLEGWLMYVISPICGCMMFDIGSRMLRKT